MLGVLTAKVRVLTLDQIARTWWPVPEAAAGLSVRAGGIALACARRTVLRLCAGGYLHPVRCMVYPMQSLAEPLLAWRPGETLGNMSELSYALMRRWTVPTRGEVLLSATPLCARAFGLPPIRACRLSEATHEVHLAEVFLRMRSVTPVRASSWIPEWTIIRERLRAKQRHLSRTLSVSPRRRKNQHRMIEGVVPDAVVDDGIRNTAIEFGGQYTPTKLMRFHRWCEGEGMGYEVW